MTSPVPATHPNGENQPETLPEARNRLQDAISALIDPRPYLLDCGRTTYLDSLYTELCDSLAGQQGTTGDHHARSLPLLWAEAHDTLTDIDSTVRKWHPEIPAAPENWADKPRPATIVRLEAIFNKKFRPQDVDMITDWTARLQAFAKTIRNLTLPEITVYLRGHTCPICGNSHAKHVDSAGEEVNNAALMIRGDSALCRHCRTVWDYPRLPMLGRMLGQSQSVGIIEVGGS